MTETLRTTYLHVLEHPLTLRQPLLVFLETEGAITIANYYRTGSFGVGDSDTETLCSLRTELMQTYGDLEADQDTLGPLPAQWWVHLQTIIYKENDTP